MTLAVASFIRSPCQTGSEDLVNPFVSVPDNFSVGVALEIFDSVLWNEIFVARLSDPHD